MDDRQVDVIDDRLASQLPPSRERLLHVADFAPEEHEELAGLDRPDLEDPDLSLLDDGVGGLQPGGDAAVLDKGQRRLDHARVPWPAMRRRQMESRGKLGCLCTPPPPPPPPSLG